jgi:tRNA nucleotidyltransferase/poly(A) polymerase
MSTIQLPPTVKEIMETINGYVVGGAVRDIILGRITHDWDIATPLNTNEIIQALKEYNPIKVGEQLGVIKINTEIGVIDVASFRADEYDGKSRKPKITQVRTLKEDVTRRDFTINGLAADLHGKVIDYIGGALDIALRRISFIGKADERIQDDPLRMLRAIRLAATLGFYIEPRSFAAINRNAHELKRISNERITEEFRKATNSFGAFFTLLLSTKLISEIFNIDSDTLYNTKHDHRGNHYGENVVEHTKRIIMAVEHQSNFILSLAAALHDIGKPAVVKDTGDKIMFIGHEKIGQEIAKNARLSLSNAESRTLLFLIGEHMRFAKLFEGGNRTIAHAIVDYKLKGITLPQLAMLNDLIAADHDIKNQENWNKIVTAFNTPRPPGEKFNNLEITKRGDAIRSVWIADTLNSINRS